MNPGHTGAPKGAGFQEGVGNGPVGSLSTIGALGANHSTTGAGATLSTIGALGATLSTIGALGIALSTTGATHSTTGLCCLTGAGASHIL